MVPLQVLLAGTLGIALVAGAAAAVNCLVEQKTRRADGAHPPPAAPARQVTSLQTLVFAGVVGGAGLVACCTSG